MNYFSQCGEDKWIAENIQLPDRGFYLDIGCAHPQYGSNTGFLRAKGWLGLGIDANPAYGKFWPQGFVCGVVSSHPVVRFEFNHDPGWSRVGPQGVYMATTTINRLIEYAGLTPDFISLDVEGHEYEALLSMDIQRVRPQVIVSEHSTAMPDAPPKEDFRVKHHLEAQGYKEVHRTEANIIFLRQ